MNVISQNLKHPFVLAMILAFPCMLPITLLSNWFFTNASITANYRSQLLLANAGFGFLLLATAFFIQLRVSSSANQSDRRQRWWLFLAACGYLYAAHSISLLITQFI